MGFIKREYRTQISVILPFRAGVLAQGARHFPEVVKHSSSKCMLFVVIYKAPHVGSLEEQSKVNAETRVNSIHVNITSVVPLCLRSLFDGLCSGEFSCSVLWF